MIKHIVPIPIFMEEPFLEAVPPIRLLDWTSDSVKSFPLSLIKGGINQKSLFLCLYSFETYPSQQSKFSGVLKLNKGDIKFSFTTEDFYVKLGENIISIPDIKFIRDGGETLEGVYWGGTIIIPVNIIKTLEPTFQVVPNYQIEGNFFKYQTEVLICSAFPPQKTGILLLNI